MTKDNCDVFRYDEKKVEKLTKMLEPSTIVAATKIFKALADETRLKIAYILCLEKELCVCDVATTIGATTATASHHLRHLKKLGLAKYRKEGKLVFYSLDDDHVKELIINAMEHGREGKAIGGK